MWEYERYKAPFHASAALRSRPAPPTGGHPLPRPWWWPQCLAAACRSGAPHGVAKAQRSLDMLLRSMRVETIVAVGVSLNRGIPGMTMEAINHGYSVIVPRDCVAGYPASYGELVIEHTLAAIATITTSTELMNSSSLST